MYKEIIIVVTLIALVVLIAVPQLEIIYGSKEAIIVQELYEPGLPDIKIGRNNWIGIEFKIPEGIDSNVLIGFQLKAHLIDLQGGWYRGGISRTLTTDSSKWLMQPQEHSISVGWYTVVDSVNIPIESGETFYYIGMVFAKIGGHSAGCSHYGTYQSDVPGFKTYKCPSGGYQIPSDSGWSEYTEGGTHPPMVAHFKVMGAIDINLLPEPEEPPEEPDPDDPYDPDDPTLDDPISEPDDPTLDDPISEPDDPIHPVFDEDSDIRTYIIIILIAILIISVAWKVILK